MINSCLIINLNQVSDYFYQAVPILKIPGFLILVLLSLPGFSQFRIVGKLVSKNSGEPIPYATILDIENSQNGTTSNEQGEFKLLMPSGSGNNRILISMVANQDTILTVSQLAQTDFPLKLNEQITQLEDVIYSPNDEQHDIGKPFGQVQETSVEFTIGLSSFVGAYIHKKKNQKGIISSLSLCIANEGFPTAPFFIRMLKIEEGKVKNNYLHPIAKMSDVFPEPLIVEADGPGWIEIDLRSYNAELPEKDFFVIISPIDHGEKYKWTRDGNERYGITIASYLNIVEDIQFSVRHKERIAPIIHSSDKRSPAIAISYLTQKSKK